MKKIILFALLSIASLGSFAWNGSGHMTCGAIAYYYLKAHDPAVLAKVEATLRQHPWYSAAWADKTAGMTEEEKKVALFMLASTYPDDARSNPDLGGGEKTKWHYVDYPFVRDSSVHFENPKSPNAEEKILELISAIPKEPDGAQKATDLAWLFHLVEDIHQPLHTVSLYDKDHPHGDRGGNDTYIRLDSVHDAVKLHSYWDGLVKGTMKTIPGLAEKALASGSMLGGEVEETAPKQWITSSFHHAVRDAYESGRMAGTKEKPTYVGKDYAKMSKALAEHQVYLAGTRLAKTLIALYP